MATAPPDPDDTTVVHRRTGRDPGFTTLQWVLAIAGAILGFIVGLALYRIVDPPAIIPFGALNKLLHFLTLFGLLYALLFALFCAMWFHGLAKQDTVLTKEKSWQHVLIIIGALSVLLLMVGPSHHGSGIAQGSTPSSVSGDSLNGADPTVTVSACDPQTTPANDYQVTITESCVVTAPPSTVETAPATTPTAPQTAPEPPEPVCAQPARIIDNLNGWLVNRRLHGSSGEELVTSLLEQYDPRVVQALNNSLYFDTDGHFVKITDYEDLTESFDDGRLCFNERGDRLIERLRKTLSERTYTHSARLPQFGYVFGVWDDDDDATAERQRIENRDREAILIKGGEVPVWMIARGGNLVIQARTKERPARPTADAQDSSVTDQDDSSEPASPAQTSTRPSAPAVAPVAPAAPRATTPAPLLSAPRCPAGEVPYSPSQVSGLSGPTGSGSVDSGQADPWSVEVRQFAEGLAVVWGSGNIPSNHVPGQAACYLSAPPAAPVIVPPDSPADVPPTP